jgi:transposase
VWDNGPVHRNNLVKKFLAKHATRIEAHFLPAYGFDLMPIEGFNAQLKVREMKNHTAKDTSELHAMVRRKARRIQRNRHKCRKFWGQTPLLVA